MANGLFITGTGTDVGKTIVTGGLIRKFTDFGVDCLAVKPVQSGGIPDDDGFLHSPDGAIYKGAGGVWNSDAQCPFIFEPECSPHLAAELSGERVSCREIAMKVSEVEHNGFVLAEGAGGILVPINENETMLDLMRELGYPVILVSPNRLGTINDTLLSLIMLKSAGIKVAGVIMTNPSSPCSTEYGMDKDNISTIEKFSGELVSAQIPYIEKFDPADEKSWEIVDKALQDLKIFELINS